jgi:hypothetical protein
MVVGKERVHTGLAWNAPAVGRAAMTRWWQQLRQMVATARRQASRSVHEMGATSRNIQGASSDVGKHRAALTVATGAPTLTRRRWQRSQLWIRDRWIGFSIGSMELCLWASFCTTKWATNLNLAEIFWPVWIYSVWVEMGEFR